MLIECLKEDAERRAYMGYTADSLGAIINLLSDNAKVPLYTELITKKTKKEPTAEEIKNHILERLME